MLDRLFLKYLSKTGKVAYWVGQIIFDGIFVFYLFGIAGYTLGSSGTGARSQTEMILFPGVIGIAIVWGIVCYFVWPADK